jgi:hypothetical protein
MPRLVVYEFPSALVSLGTEKKRKKLREEGMMKLIRRSGALHQTLRGSIRLYMFWFGLLVRKVCIMNLVAMIRCHLTGKKNNENRNIIIENRC